MKAQRMPGEVLPSEVPGREQNLRGSNQSGMRAYNERLVLSLVRRHGSLVKTQLAAMTGLSAQTISVIMRALENEGLLVRGDPIRGKVGQPSVPLSLNPSGAFFIGLKIGRRSADLVLIDFLGRQISVLHRLYAFPEPKTLVEFVKDGLRQLIAPLDDEVRSRIAGVGIAMPFQMWNWHNEVGAPRHVMDQWRDVDIRSEIAAVSDFPVYIQNDATAACAAELVFGARSHRDDFIYFYVGTFIGGGVVLNGNLYPGRTGNAGAMGSMPIPDETGRSERLIDHASLIGLERMLAGSNVDPSILWRDPQDWSSIADHLDVWIATVGRGLAHAIVASISVIDFEAAVIDGSMPSAVRDRVVDATRVAVGDLDLQGLTIPDIDAGSIGSMARALGAASLPLSDRYLLGQSAPTADA